jgi:hypothetical protein
MTDDQLLEGACECGEKGPLGDICDICGGVFTERKSDYDDFDDEDLDAYPKALLKKEDSEDSDVLPLEALDADNEEDDKFDD